MKEGGGRRTHALHACLARTVSVSQTRTDLSSEAEASSRESRAHATSDTPWEWPESSMLTRPRFLLLLPLLDPRL